MYNSMYYRASHPHIHHPLGGEDGIGGGRGGFGGSVGSLGVRSKSITAAAVIGAPINIVTHSIIKNVNSSFGGGQNGSSLGKSLAFEQRFPTTLFEEDEDSGASGAGGFSSEEKSDEAENIQKRPVMRSLDGMDSISIASDVLEWNPKSMDV